MVNSNKPLIHGTIMHSRISHYIMGEFKGQINFFGLCFKMESTGPLACQDSSDLGHMKDTWAFSLNIPFSSTRFFTVCFLLHLHSVSCAQASFSLWRLGISGPGCFSDMIPLSGMEPTKSNHWTLEWVQRNWANSMVDLGPDYSCHILNPTLKYSGFFFKVHLRSFKEENISGKGCVDEN